MNFKAHSTIFYDFISPSHLSSPRHTLTPSTNQDSHLSVGHAVEVIGKVDQNLALKVQASTDFGTNIGNSFVPILPSLLRLC